MAPPLADDESNGPNTVATYVFWNLHEVEPGKWDFSGDKNLAEYIRIAGEEGMMVILRPGPYVCAEWEFGGYPWWLQNIPGMEIKRDNTEFLKYTKKYIDRLYEEVGLSLWYSVKMSLAHTFPSVGIFLSINNICV